MYIFMDAIKEIELKKRFVHHSKCFTHPYSLCTLKGKSSKTLRMKGKEGEFSSFEVARKSEIQVAFVKRTK